MSWPCLWTMGVAASTFRDQNLLFVLRKLVETDHFYKKKPSAEYGLLVDMPNRSLLMLSSIGHVSALGFIVTPWISGYPEGHGFVQDMREVTNLKYFLGNLIPKIVQMFF